MCERCQRLLALLRMIERWLLRHRTAFEVAAPELHTSQSHLSLVGAPGLANDLVL
jgi:hypothetical protein